MASCGAAELKTDGVVLMQGDRVFASRGIVAADMAAYLQATEAAAAAALAPATLPQTAGYLLFAVRAGKLSNAWSDLRPALPPATDARLIQAVRSVPPFYVAHGTVLFAVRVKVNGASAPAVWMPRPPAWELPFAAQKGSVEIEAFVQRIWP